MTLLEELKVFFRHILYWVYSFAGFSFFFFVFGLKKVVIWEKIYLLPLPTEDSFSVLIFNKIRQDLIPSGVELIVTNPMSAFVSQVSLSLLLGFLLTIPIFLYKIVMYIKPALLPHEKKVIFWSLFPLAFLFFSGALFSYFFLVPATFKVLYPYATSIGVTPFFSLDEFINYVFILMAGVGLTFLLPLFMILLSVIGIVKAEFWKSRWRYALLFFLILSAIITPDGTGVTMVMLFVPLATLYFLGYIFANKLSKMYNY